jgi:diguanylate cyclase
MLHCSNYCNVAADPGLWGLCVGNQLRLRRRAASTLDDMTIAFPHLVIPRMTLDVQTLIVLLLGTLFAISIALPVLMGLRVSVSARCVQASVIAQALAWTSFVAAGRWNDRFFSTVCMALLSASFVLMWRALQGWLGDRPGGPWLWGLACLTPLGYGLGFDHYAFRVGWSNFGLALQMGFVCLALAWPTPEAGRGWRGMVFVCLAALALVTAWRGVLGAFFTADYPYFRAPHPVNLAGAVLNHVSLVLTTLGFLVAWREEAERELRKLASTDGLTGLLNRRTFEQRAEDYLSLARRHHDPLVLLLIDLDHFKQINDRQGHAGGDRALQLFAQVLRRCVRRGDLACRYGGEEFCVLLSRTSGEVADIIDRRLRAELASAGAAQGFAPSLSFSTGLTVVTATDTSLESIVRRADEALYKAKNSGRGRMVRA